MTVAAPSGMQQRAGTTPKKPAATKVSLSDGNWDNNW